MGKESFVNTGMQETAGSMRVATEILGTLAGSLVKKLAPTYETYRDRIIARIASRKIGLSYRRSFRPRFA